MESQRPFLVEEEEEEEEEVALRRSTTAKYDEKGNGNEQVGVTATRSSSSGSGVSCCSELEHEVGAGDASKCGNEGVEENEAEKVEYSSSITNTGSVYFDKEQGSECIDEDAEELQSNVVEHSNVDTNARDLDALLHDLDSKKSLTMEVNHHDETSEDNRISGSNPTLLDELPVQHGIESDTLINEDRIDEDFALIEELGQEETDFDVERVLEKQNTHDLFCPNCHSCITRRVILRRRKRKVRNIHRKPKHSKPGTITELELDSNYTVSTNDHQGQDTIINRSDDIPSLAAEENWQDRDVDVFRCLSCFSIFIPTGSGFKLFQISKSKPENENVQLPPNVTSANKNWFFSIFTTNKMQSKIEEGNVTEDDAQIPEANDYLSKAEDRHIKPPQGLGNDMPQESGMDIVINSRVGEHVENTVAITGGRLNEATAKANPGGVVADHEITDTVKKWNSSSYLDGLPSQQKTGHLVASHVVTLPETIDDASLSLKQDGKHSALSSTWESSVAKQLQRGTDRDIKEAVGIEKRVNIIQASSTSGTGKAGIDATIITSTTGIPALEEVRIYNGQKAFSDVDRDINAAVGIEEHGNAIQASSTTGTNKTGIDVAISSTIGISALEKVEIDSQLEAVSDVDKNLRAAIGTEEPIPVIQASSTIETQKARIDASISSTIGIPVLEKVKVDNGQRDFGATEKQVTGNDLIVVVESEPPEAAPSQRVPDAGIPVQVTTLPQSGTQAQMSAQRDTGVGIDILKSIVYGGLIESITSLGVVSSAAGGGAATLNILALGLANLIGGLFILCHNLFDLKNDQSGETSGQASEQEDRYQVLLGRRNNFTLHATVVIISYLLFGLLPPVIYGLAFRKSDNKDYKLVAVGAASLICIVLLATGKAHVQRQPRHYIRTVLHYVIIGIMASGASYVVGDLIGMLLEKIGWSDSSAAMTMTIPDTEQLERSWSSY